MKEIIKNSRFVRWLDSLEVWKKLKAHPFFGRLLNYEFISYIFFGVLTTVVNYLVFFLMPRFESGGLDLVLANTAAWIAAVAFAFVTNKLYVFESKDRTRSAVLSELVPFVTCRLLSLVMETLILYVTVTLLRFNEPLMKILSGILVIIVNYFASKYLIFRKEKDAPASGEETE